MINTSTGWKNSLEQLNIILDKTVSKRICVIGDSLDAQSYATTPMWPYWLGVVLNQNGIRCEVVTKAVNAHSFGRVINTPVYGSKTVLQSAIDYDADVYIVACGINSVINPVDGENLSQAIADGTSLFSQLRAAKPSAEIYYASQIPYDRELFPNPLLLKNKGTAPNLMTLRSSGLLTNTYCSEILDDDLGSTKRTEIDNWRLMDIAIRALPTINGTIDLELFKIARLGYLGPDGYHFIGSGHHLIAASALTDLITIGAPFVVNIADQLKPNWSNINTMFTTYLTVSGNGYVTAIPTEDDGQATYNLPVINNLNSWYLPYKSTFNFFPRTVKTGTSGESIYFWEIRGGKPNTQVQENIAEAGSVFYDSTRLSDGFNHFTDENGDIQTAGVNPLPAGTYTFRFKVGPCVYGPITVTSAV